MKLRFYARENKLAYVPGVPKTQGQAPPYLGRTIVRGTASAPASFPANAAPHEVEIHENVTASAQLFNRYVKLAKDGAIWPADEATASACGVEFVPVKFDGGAWVAAPKKERK